MARVNVESEHDIVDDLTTKIADLIGDDSCYATWGSYLDPVTH